MSVRIICDSACDLPQAEGEKLNVRILPLRYYFGDEEYLDGVTISNTEFYEKLENNDLFPKTSQITPFQYGEEFEKALEKYDEVLCLTISSGVSGCNQSANTAAMDYEGKVLVFDAKHFCFSYTVLVKYAARLRDEGLSAKQIYEKLENALKKVRIIASFNTLEYLKKGGRISGSVSAIGNALGIKPIITITDGKVDVIKLVRGSKKAAAAVNEYISNCDIDLNMPFVCGYTGTDSKQMDEFMEKYGSAYFGNNIEELIVGTTVGSYAGPGAYALGFFVK